MYDLRSHKWWKFYNMSYDRKNDPSIYWRIIKGHLLTQEILEVIIGSFLYLFLSIVIVYIYIYIYTYIYIYFSNHLGEQQLMLMRFCFLRCIKIYWWRKVTVYQRYLSKNHFKIILSLNFFFIFFQYMVIRFCAPGYIKMIKDSFYIYISLCPLGDRNK